MPLAADKVFFFWPIRGSVVERRIRFARDMSYPEPLWEVNGNQAPVSESLIVICLVKFFLFFAIFTRVYILDYGSFGVSSSLSSYNNNFNVFFCI